MSESEHIRLVQEINGIMMSHVEVLDTFVKIKLRLCLERIFASEIVDYQVTLLVIVEFAVEVEMVGGRVILIVGNLVLF